MPGRRASEAAGFRRNAGDGNHVVVASGCYEPQGDPECAYILCIQGLWRVYM